MNTYTHSLSENGSFRLNNKLSLDTWYTFSYQPNVVEGFQKSIHMLFASVTLTTLKKERGQVKLMVSDLLNQNRSIYRYAGTNSIITNEQEVLKRYFMLSCQYKINVVKK